MEGAREGEREGGGGERMKFQTNMITHHSLF